MNGEKGSVEYEISHGADLDFTCRETPLWWVRQSSFQKDAEKIEVGCQGHVPLALAAMDRQKEIVVLLINAGADVNAANRVDDIPADFRARNSKWAEANPSGMTPLMFAVKSGDKEIVGMLLDAGADVSLRDDNGRTAMDIARKIRSSSKRDNIVDLLLEHGG